MTKHKIDLFGLMALVVVYSFFNYLWVIHESRPPHWDMACHLYNSLVYLHNFHFKTFYLMWWDYHAYPPLRYWLTLPFYFLFGTSMTVAIMSNIVFVAILVFSVYGIGIELWDRSTALLACLFILSMPMFSSQFKEYQLDAQLSAMVALSLYLLILCREFSDRRLSLLYGLSFGLGMLTKWTFAPCMAFPLAYSIWKAAQHPPATRKTAMDNLKWSALIAAGASLLWYGCHPRKLFIDLFEKGVHPEDAPWHSLTAFFWYPQQLVTTQFYLLPTCLFIAGLVFTLVRKHRPNLYLLLLVFGSYLLLLPIHKDVRYTMPMLVGASIFSVYWILLLKNQVIRYGVMTLVMAYCLFSYWGTSFGFGSIPKDIEWGPVLFFSQSGYSTSVPPTHEQWHQEEMFKKIATYPEKDRTVGTDCLDTMWFNGWGLNYYALKYGVQLVEKGQDTPLLLERTDKPLKIHPAYLVVEQYDLPDKSILRLLKKND